MKSKRKLVGPCGTFGLALIALSLTLGRSPVRAEEPDAASPVQNIVSDPIVSDPVAKAVQTVELRLVGVEATVMSFAGSFSSDHITTELLCVSDGSGETCITKAQLDALLKLQAQLSRAPAATEPAATTGGEARAPPAIPEAA